MPETPRADKDDWSSLYGGLRIQLETLHLWEAAGETLGGWKVGMTSGKNRDKMGKGFRPFGYVLSSRILTSGSSLARNRIQTCQVEPELCLVVGAPLGGANLKVEEVRNAISAVAPAFEINELRRFGAETPPSISIAEDLSNWGIAVGEGVPVSDVDLTQTEVIVTKDDVVMASTIPGSGMDNPFLSIIRLCEVLSRYGLSLQPGQKVITGAFSHHPVTEIGTWRANFQGIGIVDLAFN
ncbi:MAG: hypothetical protein WA860_02755 [Acidimicrobiales bacterium]